MDSGDSNGKRYQTFTNGDPRHSHVNDLTKKDLISADHAAWLKPRGLIADNDLRPDSITGWVLN